MNEQDLARKIARHLDYGLDEIRPDTCHRLLAARRTALARHDAPQPAFGLAWAGAVKDHLYGGRLTVAHYVIAAVLLAAGGAGITYWHMAGDEDADVEINLLTGELPINAYLDSEFEAWLKRSSQ